MNKQIFVKRIKSLQQKMCDNSVLVIQAPPPAVRNRDVHHPYRATSDLIYLTGADREDLAVFIFNDSEPVLFSNERSPDESRWMGHIEPVERIAERMGLSDENIHSLRELNRKLPELLKNRQTLYAAFLEEHSSFLTTQLLQSSAELARKGRQGDFGPTRFFDKAEIIDELRLIKDEFEIEQLRKACSITARAHNRLMAYTRSAEELSEASARAFLEGEFMKQGAVRLAYPSITAAAENATVLHYEEFNRRVSADELLLIDAGCEWGGYASDITRTFPAGGRFSDTQKEIYTIVLTAQQKALSLCRPGENLDSIHEAAMRSLSEDLFSLGVFNQVPDLSAEREKHEKPPLVSAGSVDEVIEKKLFRHYFMHKTSHFLGLDVHDVGSYYLNHEPRALEPGMVFTVEPGLYFPPENSFIPEKYRGIGIRIEDDILITSEGSENLTSEAVKTVSDIESIPS